MSESSNLSFEPESISSSCVTSLDHFHSFQPSASISLNDTVFQNTVNNYYTGLEMCHDRQNPASGMQHCFNENHFNFTPRFDAENCLYKDGLFNECSLPYEHDSHNSIVNSGPEFNQSCDANNFSTSCKNPVRTPHNIRPTLIVEDSNLLGINELKFNTCPSVNTDQDKNLPFSYSGLGMGKMKIEYWDIMVFSRNHSVYVNPELMARSIGLTKPLVRKLIETKPVLQKMTQLEVSILKYIGYLSTTTHNTSLIPLTYFLDTLHAKLDKNKPYQAYVKNTIKTFTDKLNNGFVPNISNLPYDLSPFFNANQSYEHSNEDESKKSLQRFEIVSHLSLENKSFSLIEHNGDFYMHLGELVSNGLFPSVNLVRRKIRKMHISTKWLDPIDSQYLNLSADQELVKFSDLRILCGLIFYLNPNERTDLLQMFSAMDLSDFISTVNPVNPQHYHSNDVPVEDNAKNEFQNQTAQSRNRPLLVKEKELLLTESSIISSKILVNPQRKVLSAHDTENQFDFNVQIEKPNKNCYLESGNINNDSLCVMQESSVPSSSEKGNPTLPEVRVKQCKNVASQGQNFMYPATNGEVEADVLSLSFEELLDGNLNIYRPPSDEPTNDNICTTCDKNQGMCCFENLNKSTDCCLPSAPEFPANLQLTEGSDRFNYENPNYSTKQSLKNKTAFQISDVFQASAPNNDTFNKEHQILPRQFIDLTATNLMKNCFSTSNNNFGIYPLANLSEDESFAGSVSSTNTSLEKRLIDPQKFFKPDNYVTLNESNTDQSATIKSCTFDDKNQSNLLQFNRNVNLHSGLLPPLANEDASEIPVLPMISSGEVCNKIRISSLKTPTFANEEQLLSISPQIALPTINNIQKTRSFQERKKDSILTRNEYSLSKPNKMQHFSSNSTQSKNQGNDAFQVDDNLPSIRPYTIDNMLPQNGDSANGNLLPVDAGQILTSNTTFQRQEIDSSPMQESFDNHQNVSYKSCILSDNTSLLDNTPIPSSCVSFQNETSCCDDNEVTPSPAKSKLTLQNSVKVGGKIPIGKNAVLKKTSFSAEPLLPVKNKNRLITLKERDLTLCTEVSSCDEFKECSTPSRYSDGSSNMKKSTTLSAIPSNLASNNFTILSPVVALNRFDRIDIFQKNESNTSLTKNLNQSLPNGNLTEIEKVTNCKILRPEISLQNCEMHKNETISQEHVGTKSWIKELQENPLNMKPQTESDSTAPKVHELEIASMEAIDTLAIEINQNKLSNCALQHVKAKNCSLILPHFETTDMRSKSNNPLIKDTSEVEMKDSEDTSTSSSVIIDAEKKEVIKELSNFNQLLTNNQFPKETSHTMDLNSLNSITNDKKKNLFEVTSSCTESMENDSQSVKCNLIRNNKLQCQKTIIQNESHYPVSSYSKSMGETHKNEFNMKSIVIKDTKQLNSHSSMMSVGAGSSEWIKTTTIEPESVPQTRSKQISITDMVDIVKLYTTKNRLHLDVAITEQARMIFEDESKDNPVEPKKIFLQQFTDLVCQFAKRWFDLRAAKSLDHDGNQNSVKPIPAGKTTFQKDVFTRYGYPPDAAKKDLQMPTIFHPSITSCRCSTRLCGVMKMSPENEASKIHETNSKGKHSNTSDVYWNSNGKPLHKSDQSNLALLEKTELNHDSSKVYEIECRRFIAKDDPSCNEFVSKIDLTKRNLPSLENVKAKKKKLNKQ